MVSWSQLGVEELSRLANYSLYPFQYQIGFPPMKENMWLPGICHSMRGPGQSHFHQACAFDPQPSRFNYMQCPVNYYKRMQFRLVNGMGREIQENVLQFNFINNLVCPKTWNYDIPETLALHFHQSPPFLKKIGTYLGHLGHRTLYALSIFKI